MLECMQVSEVGRRAVRLEQHRWH